MTDPVKSFVKNNSGNAAIFQELNIDFCCGGDVSLQTACEEKGLKIDEVYQRLMAVESPANDEKDICWKIKKRFVDKKIITSSSNGKH